MTTTPTDAAQLIAIDWGTSNLRAGLLGPNGRPLGQRSAPGGVMAVKDRQFAAALRVVCGDWLTGRRLPMIASGMIGSRQGWREAAYLPCPARLDQVAAQLTPVPLDDGPEPPDGGPVLHIVPGLRCTGADGRHDVMRGEETQLWGAGLAAGSCCVLPGTHAKWAWMGDGGTVSRFQTFMTGELYALLTQHGILGRLMAFGQWQPQAFEQGVRLGLAEHARATHVIFAARTAGLMGQLPAEALPDYLSGILVGVEIGSVTRDGAPQAVTVLGDDALAMRYELALHTAGIATRRAADDATTRGQWAVAQAAGLVAADGSGPAAGR